MKNRTRRETKQMEIGARMEDRPAKEPPRKGERNCPLCGDLEIPDGYREWVHKGSKKYACYNGALSER